MEELRVIQGDTLNATITIENPEQITITQVVFYCPSLEIEKNLGQLANYNDDVWGFSLGPTETSQLRVGRWDFDIKAYTNQSQIFTVIKGNFVVDYSRVKAIIPPSPEVISGIGYTED